MPTLEQLDQKRYRRNINALRAAEHFWLSLPHDTRMEFVWSRDPRDKAYHKEYERCDTELSKIHGWVEVAEFPELAEAAAKAYAAVTCESEHLPEGMMPEKWAESMFAAILAAIRESVLSAAIPA